MKTVVTMATLIFLTMSCTSKIELGKKCTQDGKVYSYIWIKEKPVDQTIMYNNCNEALKGK